MIIIPRRRRWSCWVACILWIATCLNSKTLDSFEVRYNILSYRLFTNKMHCALFATHDMLVLLNHQPRYWYFMYVIAAY